MNNIFLELTAVLALAGLIAVLIKPLKQPTVIAYIIVGLIIGPLGYINLRQTEVFHALAEIGITLLLFMVGLELDVSQLRRIGKSVLITGAGKIILATLAGFFLLRFLNFSETAAWLIAPTLTFSSTIIGVKLLSEKRDLQSLYGKLVTGILLMQDFTAMIILISLSSISPVGASIYSGLPAWQNILMTLVRMLILGLFISWMATKVFPKIMKYIGKNDELLLVFSLAWALGLAVVVSQPFMGFSLEIGGFLAGLALARSSVHYEISAKIKSLRDFFIIIFFIVLGSGLVLNDFGSLAKPALILSLFVVLANPLIVLVLLALQGFKPRTGFLTGVTVSQISEFSLILAALGLKMGILTPQEVGLLTLVGIATIGISSYMILYCAQISDRIRWLLRLLDFRKGSAEKGLGNLSLKNHVILIGAHRMGKHLIHSLKGNEADFVVVDFNPEIVETLLEQNVPAICGDITDPYIQEEVNLENAVLIISTIPDFKDNLTLLDTVRSKTQGRRKRPKLVFLAQDEEEIRNLYEKDIDYVISPHFMGGLHLAKILEEDGSLKSLKKLKEKHLKLISG